MIRVLHSVSYMHRAGVETFLMNYFRNIDRSVIQFDFLCNKQAAGEYDNEIRQLGGRIFYRPGFDLLQEENYVAFWRGFLGEHPEIQIIHSHNGAKQYYPLQGAKEAGFPIRIAHAHSSDFVHDEKYQYRRSLIARLPQAASFYFGCSDKAGRFFFGDEIWEEKGVLIRNAVPCEQLAWNPELRQMMRSRLGLSRRFVIGHVGRFMTQKNHSRLLDIFQAVYQRNQDARLLLVGEGELMETIRQKANRLNIESAVIFAGNQADMAQWYQAMDVFVMPSFFEGLPVSGIEAQAAGLPCVFSDAVSAEASVTKDVRFVPLGSSDSEWADVILSFVNHKRYNTHTELRNAGYDISIEAIHLQEKYVRILQEHSETEYEFSI